MTSQIPVLTEGKPETGLITPALFEGTMEGGAADL